MNPRWLVDLAKLAFVIVILLLLYKAARGQDFPNCTEFGFQISTSCCCSAGCCKEAKEGEVVHVEGDLYRIVPSGQIIKRTGWSPDGRTIRCACDLIENKWTVHPTAFTRCLYMPMPSS
jgi:hypothetical protein